MNNLKQIGLLAGAVALLAGFYLDFTYANSTPNAVPTLGTIVDFDRRHSKQVYPVFEFKDAGGVQHRVVSPTQQTVLRFAAGDTVAIVYSKDNPANARIDTLWFDHRWLAGGLLVAVTIAVATFRGSGFAPSDRHMRP